MTENTGNNVGAQETALDPGRRAEILLITDVTVNLFLILTDDRFTRHRARLLPLCSEVSFHTPPNRPHEAALTQLTL